MRRSEAVEIVRLALSRWNGAFYDGSLESFIVSELETAEMLPPGTDYRGNQCEWDPEA